MIRGWLSGLLLLVAAVGLVGPEHEYGEPELSRDGRTWTGAGGGALFSSSDRWVPGESRSSAFWVRSRDPGGADLSVDLRRSGAQDTEPVRLEARLGTGDWVEIGPGGFHTLHAVATTDPQESLPVTVRATFPAGVATAGMRGSTDLDVRVSTVESDRFTGLRVPGGPDGTIPDTWGGVGAALLLPVTLVLALAVIGLAVGRRRTSRVDSDAQA